MLGEAFGIVQVYVPLCGYYEQPKDDDADARDRGRMAEPRSEVVRHVVDLEEELTAWVEAPKKEEPAVRVIAGGPGSGKSSFAKMFAARLAARRQRVLHVPLHLIDPEKDLETAIGQFVRQQGIFEENPLDPALGERLLLLLDGLDELAMQGKASAEVAHKFVQEVIRLVDNRNHGDTRLQVLIGGREIVVQMCRFELRKPRQVLYFLPYYLNPNQANAFADERKLLAIDRRHQWWRNYGVAKGKDYNTMPKGLLRKDLDEITAQPLLGYLVALSFDRGKVDFSSEHRLSRNVIYQDLISAVYDRTYAGKPHPSVRGLSMDDFLHLLEEVGLSTWHGDGRTTTVSSIQTWCSRSGFDKLLDAFQEGATAGATRLLTAFYFRQGDRRQDGERTFEFTHKSFGEYLASRRVVRALETMQDEMETRVKKPGRGWSEREALKHWLEICGPTAMDEYILNFVIGEVSQLGEARAKTWQATLSRLIEHLLRQGMPLEDLSPRLPYAEEARHARNAEEALLACLSVCAQVSGNVSRIAWPDRTSFGKWIRTLQGQRTGPKNVLALESLGRLELKEQACYFVDLYGAYLEHANLEDISLFGAVLGPAILKDANLERADLVSAYLQGANLRGANLRGANLQGANLWGANLQGANLQGANLRDANTQDASLPQARHKTPP